MYVSSIHKTILRNRMQKTKLVTLPVETIPGFQQSPFDQSIYIEKRGGGEQVEKSSTLIPLPNQTSTNTIEYNVTQCASGIA